jgi:hypothetical protein
MLRAPISRKKYRSQLAAHRIRPLARLQSKRSPAAIGAALGVTVAAVAFLFGENTSAGLLGALLLGAAVALGFSGVQFLGDWVARHTRSNRRTNS